MIFPSLDKLEMGQINILFKPPVLFMVICFIYDIYSCPDLGKDLDNVPLSDINSRNILFNSFLKFVMNFDWTVLPFLVKSFRMASALQTSSGKLNFS